MEVYRPVPNKDFYLNSTAPSSPSHYSTPSSPIRFGDYYISAPSSPSQVANFYSDIDALLLSPSPSRNSFNEAEFAFDISDDFGRNQSVSADELFHGGVIKPMQFPPSAILSTSAAAPAVSRGKSSRKMDKRSPEQDRGRERTPLISSSSRRAARSLSPVRVSQYPWEEHHHQQHQCQQQKSKEQSITPITKPTSSSISNNKSQLPISASKGPRKWRLKDFFLFRSASEGRSADKDPLRKYTAAIRRCEEVKGGASSSKNITVESSGSGSVSKRKGKVSAHELHYTANRAVSEDLKKKTFLPYKQGILGRLAFNPAVHAVGYGFGFSRK